MSGQEVWSSRRAGLLVAAAAAAPFLAALAAPFVFDDEAEVVGSVSPLAALGARLPRLGRPLLKLTYALGLWAHGPSASAVPNVASELGKTSIPGTAATTARA